MRRKLIYLLLIVSFPLFSLAQRSITGKVTAAAGGGALPGVSIVVEGNTLTGTTTNADGAYTINVPSNAVALVFSFVGKVTATVRINGRSVINVQLADDESKLADVVVIGYTTQKKETLTGAVSTIKGSDMVRTRTENAVNMLTGKLPGVRIAQKSSRPGAYDATIDIRGMAQGTNPPGTPLFVIDGIVRDQGYFSRMSGEEIESISVLKDGSAAVYGLRAGNGVILVTTKSGASQNGKVDITYSSNITEQQYLYVPEGVTAQDYYALRNEQWLQDFNNNYLVQRTPVFSDAEIQAYKDGTKKQYNWMDQVFRKHTPQYDNNLSVNGGNEKIRYYFNLGYTKQGGSYKSNDLKSERWSFRSNLEAQITKRLKATIQVGALLTNTEEPNGTGWPTYKATWLLRPDAPYYANDNPAYLNGDNNQIPNGDNMVAKTSADYVGLNTTHDKRYNGTLRLEYQIPGIKGLSVKGLYDYSMGLPDYNNYHQAFNLYRYDPIGNTYTPSLQGSPSNIQKRTSLNYDRTMQGGIYYTNSFNKNHVSGFLLYEQTYLTRDGFSAYRELLINSQYLFAGEQTNQNASGDNLFDRSSKSVVGGVTYDFARKYLLDFKFREDGSSRFPAGSRYGFFPYVSAGWRLSEEGFIRDNIDFISELKLRASYGETGDDGAAANYPPTTGYVINGSNVGWYFNGVLNSGVSPSTLPNPNLTWYKNKNYDAGLDFGFLKNKITGSIDIFKRDRSGLLATSSAVIPGTVGANLPQENLNSDRNFGYELTATFRNGHRDLSYYVTGQISATKYMRTNWLETPAGNSYDNWRNRTANRYQNIWWSTESGGMFTSFNDIRTFYLPQGQGATPGDWWLQDWNGDGVVDNNDQHPVATMGLPEFGYGISIGASWKNFNIALDFQGAHNVYVQYAEVLTEALSFGGQNTLTWFMDRWHPADPKSSDYFSTNTQWVPGYYPVTGHDGRRTGTNAIMNASYVRLKTAELGYTFNIKAFAKVGIKEFRLYLSGYNLLTFTPLKNVDPERPGSAGASSTNYIDFYNDPITKDFTLGAKLKF